MINIKLMNLMKFLRDFYRIKVKRNLMQPLRGMLQQYGALLFGRSGSQLQSNPFLFVKN
ncbi:hypothetical protein D3C81_665000 [compost metagenome]